MASGIRVTPEQLQQVATQLSAGAGNVDGVLAQLGASVAPLGSDWAGMARCASRRCGSSGSGTRAG